MSAVENNSIADMPVTLLADPHATVWNDTGPSYAARAFANLIKSKDWKRARKTFCGALLSGQSIDTARLHTLAVHGIY